MSGCISPESNTTKEDTCCGESEDSSFTHSYQFWNENPMSIGNQSTLTLNHSGNLYLSLELSAFFHEPVSWEQGWVNYSLIYENETVWTVQVNSSKNIYNFGMTVVEGNMTIEIRASGSHNSTSQNPGDFFISESEFRLS